MQYARRIVSSIQTQLTLFRNKERFSVLKIFSICMGIKINSLESGNIRCANSAISSGRVTFLNCLIEKKQSFKRNSTKSLVLTKLFEFFRCNCSCFRTVWERNNHKRRSWRPNLCFFFFWELSLVVIRLFTVFDSAECLNFFPMRKSQIAFPQCRRLPPVTA